MGITKINGKSPVKSQVDTVEFDGIAYELIRRYTTGIYEDGRTTQCEVALVKAGDSYSEIQYLDGSPVKVRGLKSAPTKVIECGGVFLTATATEPVARAESYGYGDVAYAWKWVVNGSVAGQPVKFDPLTVARVQRFFASINTEAVGEVDAY